MKESEPLLGDNYNNEYDVAGTQWRRDNLRPDCQDRRSDATLYSRSLQSARLYCFAALEFFFFGVMHQTLYLPAGMLLQFIVESFVPASEAAPRSYSLVLANFEANFFCFFVCFLFLFIFPFFFTRGGRRRWRIPPTIYTANSFHNQTRRFVSFCVSN